MRTPAFVRAPLVLAALCAGCASTSPLPVVPELRDAGERDVVVFVPGISGTALYDREARRLTWGNFRSLVFPRDGGYDFALPIGSAPDRIEPRDPILEVVAAPGVRRDVYGPVLDLLERNGYHRGDPRAPKQGDTLFLFGYDWRRDNIDVARDLTRFLGTIPRASDGSPRRVTLLCHSNAGYLCRWAVRFGDVSLDAAEACETSRPANVRIGDVILAGTANAGAIRNLRDLHRGRIYVKLIGRRFSPELFFTLRSMYQDLPASRADLFVDADGRPMAVDVFDPASWIRFGWSIFARDAALRAARRPDIFGTPDQQLSLLSGLLDRARRFQNVLRAAACPPPEGMRFASIQSTEEATPYRAVLVRDGDRWQTLFQGDAELRRLGVSNELISLAGDGHADRASQETLSAGEAAAMSGPTIVTSGDHLGVLHSAATHRAILELLAKPR